MVPLDLLLLAAVWWWTPRLATQLPPRDARPPAAGTASVSGRVTDAESGRPIALVPVHLTLPAAGASGRFETSTDGNGRYEFANVPAGEYFISASPNEHRARYRSKSFGFDDKTVAAFNRPPPLVLNRGESRQDVDFALERAFAIEGRVVNEYGDPLADVQVRGDRVDRPGASRMVTTDDEGTFRVYGLTPGEYRVCAVAEPPPFDRPTTGDVLLSRYAKTCVPAVTGSGQSSPLTIGGTDVVGVVVQMQRTRAYTVSGRVVRASGARIEKARVTISRFERESYGSSPAPVEFAQGAFVARSVTPGDYFIRVTVDDPVDPYAPRSSYMPPREMAHVPVRVEEGNITDLIVVTTAGADLTGRIVFDGDVKPPVRAARLTVQAPRAFEAQQIYDNLPTAIAPVHADFTFQLRRVYGPVVLTVTGLPDEWIVKSVRLGATDIAAVPTEFMAGADSRSVQIVVTNRVARFTARPVDENGNLTMKGVVVLVPADPARWSNVAIQMGPMAKDGTVRLPPRIPGEYFAAAVPPEEFSRLMRDTGIVKLLAERAQRVVLIEGENRALDVRLIQLTGNR